MTSYIVARLVWTIPVLLVTIFLTVVLVRALPGEPFSNPKIAETTRETLREKYGYNDSLATQYLKLVRGLPTFDFGISSQANGTTARDLVAQRAPDTFLLGGAAFLLAAIVGSAAGVLSALWEGRPADWVILVGTTVFFAIPTFVTSIYWITYLDYNWTDLNDVSGTVWWVSGLLLLVAAIVPSANRWIGLARRAAVAIGLVGLTGGLWYAGSGGDGWGGRIGPVTVLALAILPYFTRLLRASMIEALQSDYVTTARAKGLPWWRTVARHVVRNSLIPVVTNAGPLFAFVLTGSFIIEFIFNVPGIAGLFVSSFNESGNQGRDVAVIMALTVMVSIFIVVANAVVDIVVARLDPRIAHD